MTRIARMARKMATATKFAIAVGNILTIFMAMTALCAWRVDGQSQPQPQPSLQSQSQLLQSQSVVPQQQQQALSASQATPHKYQELQYQLQQQQQQQYEYQQQLHQQLQQQQQQQQHQQKTLYQQKQQQQQQQKYQQLQHKEQKQDKTSYEQPAATVLAGEQQHTVPTQVITLLSAAVNQLRCEGASVVKQQQQLPLQLRYSPLWHRFMSVECLQKPLFHFISFINAAHFQPSPSPVNL
ncbi:PREDICTED: putative cyclin-dependent serine/threonine-protein kinase DDB_G0272797/DDB_G0274007 [Rhagoletis zephyria]|uniref:putative cyclin-dependent serine/threonine-protein kinase DDB_G0272797/DDB_G0274007 n=1 Tax=Rhagoletis zephyria TaxID=28612 RepID=UPI0008113646|nr:PREDICTED: putative cyclin-dependent serine/threonine-protein kinase DDB_G0272797/DDB_G0274007 [Rhagoletis zephyria]